MVDPKPIRSRGESTALNEVLRWLFAIPIATLVVLSLLLVMTKLIDGSWIFEALIRVFPLIQTELDPEDRCEAGLLPSSPAITVEGSVGYLAEGRFVPLEDAEIRTLRGVGAEGGIEVEAGGRFRFVTALPGDGSAACPTPPAGESLSNPLVILRAPGCEERRVPVTRAWVPRPILLSCAERS